MVFNKKFDLIFSLGEACSCTQILRKCMLQFHSYPFDWLYGSDILSRTKILTNNYKDFINIEDLEDLNMTNLDKKNLCENFFNKKNNIVFNHDFEYGKTLDETYPYVKKKYDRRAERQIRQIEKSKNILVVYLQTPKNNNILDDSNLLEVQDLLQKRFDKQKVFLLYIYCNHNNENIEIIKVSKYLYKAHFDYDGYNETSPYVVNGEKLQKLFCKIKISHKFMSIRNFISRIVYLMKYFFKGVSK